MAFKGVVPRRRRSQREDRLSSLPNDLLIGIVSLLPLDLAITTGSLSHRWHNLWTNISSIQVTQRKPIYLNDFSTGFCNTVKQITSPFIQSCCVEFWSQDPGLELRNYCWLREICSRNVAELKLIWPKYRGGKVSWSYLPNLFFQTQSLVSVELHSCFRWRLPLKDGDPVINLPNLRNLSFSFDPWECCWLEKLIDACPLLEELSLNCEGCRWDDHYLRCSNQNLRRLFLNFDFEESEVAITAPKLEYLAVRALKSARLWFTEVPSMLREVKVVIITEDFDSTLSQSENVLTSNFYESICGVEILELDVFLMEHMRRVFHNVTRLTLDMKTSHSIEILLTLVELCPAMDVLILRFSDIGIHSKHWLFSKPDLVSTLRPTLKRIMIETTWHTYYKPSKHFIELVGYLLINAIDLEHFRFSVVGDDLANESTTFKQRRELKLCKLLYNCPVAAKGCEVEFVGRVLNMSRKAGPKVWRKNGEVIPFD